MSKSSGNDLDDIFITKPNTNGQQGNQTQPNNVHPPHLAPTSQNQPNPQIPIQKIDYSKFKE